MNLAKLLAPGGREVDVLVEHVDQTGGIELRTIIRKETVPVLRSTYLLSANYRTLALGFSMLAGTPLFFFVFEAAALSIVLVFSVLTAWRSTKRIRSQARSLR